MPTDFDCLYPGKLNFVPCFQTILDVALDMQQDFVEIEVRLSDQDGFSKALGRAGLLPEVRNKLDNPKRSRLT